MQIKNIRLFSFSFSFSSPVLFLHFFPFVHDFPNDRCFTSRCRYLFGWFSSRCLTLHFSLEYTTFHSPVICLWTGGIYNLEPGLCHGLARFHNYLYDKDDVSDVRGGLDACGFRSIHYCFDDGDIRYVQDDLDCYAGDDRFLVLKVRSVISREIGWFYYPWCQKCPLFWWCQRRTDTKLGAYV